jgi:hypothetical protein
MPEHIWPVNRNINNSDAPMPKAIYRIAIRMADALHRFAGVR